jgi:hypothetical protein
VKFVDSNGKVLDKPQRVFRSNFKQKDVVVADSFLESVSAPKKSHYIPWEPAVLIENSESEQSERLNTREQEELQETESLSTLENQIRRTDSLLESVVDSLESLRSKLDSLAVTGKRTNVAKHKIERDMLKAKLSKGLEDLNIDSEEPSPALIEIGSSITQRHGALADETVFLELDEDNSNDAPLQSIVQAEPAAASKDALSTTDEKLEKLIEESEDQAARVATEASQDDGDFAELASKVEKHHKKEQVPRHRRKVSSRVAEEASRLKQDIASADQLTNQLEEFIRSKIPRRNKAPRRVSFLDLGSTTTDQIDPAPEEINIENLPSIESLRAKLADDEPQF